MPGSHPSVLLVAATEKEMWPLGDPQVSTLVTGVGMVTTTFALTQRLMESDYDLVVSIGIAGSFNAAFGIGSVVQVVADRIVELGVEDNDRFIPADEMGLCKACDVLFQTDMKLNGLPNATGITVNRVHGNADSILQVKQQFNPDIETMEGAAVAYVCEKFGVPWVQIRAISNMVEPRNRENWNIPLALKNLHVEVERYLTQFQNEA